MRRPIIATGALLALLTASAPIAQEVAPDVSTRAANAGLTRAASAGLSLTPSTTLAELLHNWGAACGMTFESSGVDGALLAAVAGLLSDVEVPAERANAFGQAILSMHSLELAPLDDGAGYEVLVADPASERPRATFSFADAAELEQARALRVALHLTLPAEQRESARWWANGLPMDAYDEDGGIVFTGRGFEALQLARAVAATVAFGE